MNSLMEWECLTVKDGDNDNDKKLKFDDNNNDNEKKLKSDFPAADIKVNDAPTFDNSTIGEKYQCTRIHEPISGSFVWKIEGFSKITMPYVMSTYFSAGGLMWRIRVYPKGSTSPNKLGLYLNSGYQSFGEGVKNVYVSFTFLLKDQISGKHKSLTIDHHFKSNTYFGFPMFLPLADLNDPTKGFLLKDSCIIEATVTMLGNSS